MKQYPQDVFDLLKRFKRYMETGEGDLERLNEKDQSFLNDLFGKYASSNRKGKQQWLETVNSALAKENPAM